MPKDHEVTPLQVKSPEACAILGIRSRLLWQFTKDGVIPHNKVNRLTLYPVAGLRAWVDAGCPTEPGSCNYLRWETEQ